jgi:hypothetical protein
MLHGNGYVDIPMVLAVGSHPLLIMQYGGDDIHRSRREPLTVIALLKLCPVLLPTDDMEAPWLFVDG